MLGRRRRGIGSKAKRTYSVEKTNDMEQRRDGAPRSTAIPASNHVQLTNGEYPVLLEPKDDWGLGANYYLARGMPVPLIGSAPLVPAMFYQNMSSEVPQGCSLKGCSPMEFCADTLCPPQTVPMQRGTHSVCAGPGAVETS
jgi:hypothetical protein